MLGLDFIRAERAAVEKAIEAKGVDVNVDGILSLDSEVRALKTEIEALRAERNAISARFKSVAPEERAELGRQAKEAGLAPVNSRATWRKSRASSPRF
jgi:seryl-tRNA synthetase